MVVLVAKAAEVLVSLGDPLQEVGGQEAASERIVWKKAREELPIARQRQEDVDPSRSTGSCGLDRVGALDAGALADALVGVEEFGGALAGDLVEVRAEIGEPVDHAGDELAPARRDVAARRVEERRGFSSPSQPGRWARPRRRARATSSAIWA